MFQLPFVGAVEAAVGLKSFFDSSYGGEGMKCIYIYIVEGVGFNLVLHKFEVLKLELGWDLTADTYSISREFLI